MTFAELFVTYGPGFFAGLLFGLLPFVLGLRSHRVALAIFSEIICIVAGTFFSLIGALSGSLTMTIFFRYLGLLVDDEIRETSTKEAEELEMTRLAELKKENEKENSDSLQQIFITAANQTAIPLATMLYERLTAMGYTVVTDNITLTPAVKECGFYTLLDQSSDILALLTPGCLLPANKSDPRNDLQLQEELGYCLQAEKNIFSVLLPGFEWPDTLPQSLTALQFTNGALYMGNNLDAVIERIIYCLSFSLASESGENAAAAPSSEEQAASTVQKMSALLESP
ncbi:MAG: hypothetical protein J6023_03400 [Clostridia bacterium]|nr:hypothetical protein [Clostridia bacterium]